MSTQTQICLLLAGLFLVGAAHLVRNRLEARRTVTDPIIRTVPPGQGNFILACAVVLGIPGLAVVAAVGVLIHHGLKSWGV